MRYFLFFVILSFCSLSSFAQVEQATLLGQWQGDNIFGSALYDNSYNEIWGIAVNNREFAVIGSTEGTHFIDVTDPNNPEEVQFVEGAVTGPAIVHRDYHDNGCYLYVVADEPDSNSATSKSTLQIIDIRDLPNSLEVIYDSDELIFRAHNIFIDEANNQLYACIANGTANPNPSFDAMRIFDISDPFNPELIATHNSIDGLSIQQVHDGYFLDNVGYLNLGPGGFAIADFTNPANPVLLGTLDNYIDQGYNHSGWLDQSGKYYYMADENWGLRMKVVKVDDPTDIEVVGFLDAGSSATTSIPHNQVVACDYLYVSYYYDGLQVYDISDPVNPVRIIEFETSSEPDANNYKGAWGVYPFLPSGNILVSDMQEGLFVFEAIDQNACAQRRQICEGNLSSTSNQANEAGLTISPNPAEDFVTISLNKSLGNELLDIYLQDITGKQIINLAGQVLQNDYTLNLPNDLAEGMYILTLQGENQRFSKKIILQ